MTARNERILVASIIASYPDNLIAIKLTASKPGKISFKFHPENPYVKDYGLTAGDGQGKTGSVSADADAKRITLRGVMEYYHFLSPHPNRSDP